MFVETRLRNPMEAKIGARPGTRLGNALKSARERRNNKQPTCAMRERKDKRNCPSGVRGGPLMP